MSRFNPSTLYCNLIGEWNFTREVLGASPTLDLLISRDKDHKLRSGKPPALYLRGRAIFAPSKAELHYREDTSLPLPNRNPLTSHREYLYKFDDDSIRVYFLQNGKSRGEFLRLEFDSEGGMISVGAHLCKTDMYEGHFDFTHPHAPVIAYTVKGPCKDYSLTTRYSRA